MNSFNKQHVFIFLTLVFLGSALLAGEALVSEKTVPPGKPEKPGKHAKATVKPDIKAASGSETNMPASSNAPSVKVSHSAIGARVTASSTHTGLVGEASAEALVDGDMSTRWSSEYSAPQEIMIDLGRVMKIDRIIIHWESAFATKYRILVSQDGKDWTNAHFFFRGGDRDDVRTDEVNMKGAPAREIRFDLDARVNDQWGFSIYEIEVRSLEM